MSRLRILIFSFFLVGIASAYDCRPQVARLLRGISSESSRFEKAIAVIGEMADGMTPRQQRKLIEILEQTEEWDKVQITSHGYVIGGGVIPWTQLRPPRAGYLLGFPSRVLDTEMGAILIPHELQHLKDFLFTGTRIDPLVMMAKLVFSKDFLLRSERRAFETQYQATRALFSSDDLQVLRARYPTDDPKGITKELVRRGIVEYEPEVDGYRFLIDSGQLNLLSRRDQALVKEFANLRSNYRFLQYVEKALTEEPEDFISWALKPYARQQASLNRTRNVYLAGGAVGGLTVASVIIASMLSDDEEE